MKKKNWIQRNWKTFLAAVVAGTGLSALINLKHDQGYEEGTYYGAKCMQDAGRRMYDDFDEKMQEYVDLTDDEEE